MNYFENINLFSDLLIEDQVNLSDFCQVQNLSSWDVLFQEGDDPQALYIIASGGLLVQKGVVGDLQNLASLESGDIVWEMAFFGEQKKRNATVVAREETKLIVIINFSLQQILEKYPELYNKLNTIIEERGVKNRNI